MEGSCPFVSLGSLAYWLELFPGEPFWRWPSLLGEVLEVAEVRGDFVLLAEGVVAHCSARVSSSAFLRPPLLLGARCTVGNCCEVKNSILLDGATVAHLNYVGDSVLGVGAHLGAGAVLSNLRLDGQSVRIQLPAGPRDTGMRKLGAFLADGAQVGCNAVLQPGTVLGRGAIVWPCLAYGGFLPAGAVAAPAEPPVIAAGKSTRAAGAV